MIVFQDLVPGEQFCIPSGLDHEFHHFEKLLFNKARSLLDNSVHEFAPLATVWTFEPSDTN